MIQNKSLKEILNYYYERNNKNNLSNQCKSNEFIFKSSTTKIQKKRIIKTKTSKHVDFIIKIGENDVQV